MDLLPKFAAGHPTGSRDHLAQRVRDTPSDHVAEAQREEKRAAERGGEQAAQGAVSGLDLGQWQGEPDESQKATVGAARPDWESQVKQTGAHGVAVSDAAPDPVGDGLAHFRPGGMVIHAAQGFAGFVGIPEHKPLRIDHSDAGMDRAAELVGQGIDGGGIRSNLGERRGEEPGGHAGLSGQPHLQLRHVALLEGVLRQPAGRP